MSRTWNMGLWAVLAVASWLGGCGADTSRFNTSSRAQDGLVVILPGIEGEGPLSHAVREGLSDGGVDYGLTIYRWGRPVPVAGMLLNQMDFIGNRLAADQIARMIVTYQDEHPGKPVFVVGHSGGGGIAVFTAEALPAGRSVDGLILLNASISSGYNLRKALEHTRLGLVNFWSPDDLGLLYFGTTLFGNVDGMHGPGAGAAGFRNTGGLGRLKGELHQVKWSQQMAASGNNGGHTGSTSELFVGDWVAPWILARTWSPAPRHIIEESPPQEAPILGGLLGSADPD